MLEVTALECYMLNIIKWLNQNFKRRNIRSACQWWGGQKRCSLHCNRFKGCYDWHDKQGCQAVSNIKEIQYNNEYTSAVDQQDQIFVRR
jgi:hypothetical protein